MSLVKHKNGVWYYHFVNSLSGKRNSKSTGMQNKHKAMSVILKPEFQSCIAKPKERFRLLYIEELRAEVMKYVLNNLEYSTAKLYKTVFDIMKRIFKDKPIKLISASDIEHYKNVRIGEVRKATVNKDLTIMKTIFNIAIRFEWIYKNPVKGVKKLSIPEKEHLAFTDSQIKLFLENIPIQSIKNFVIFALLTGCRLNEIINLQWKDINFAEMILTIRNKPNFKTKTGKIRQIPISEKLFELLIGIADIKTESNIISFINPDKYIFCKTSQYKYNKNYVSKYFKTVLRSLNFNEKYHFHCLRHTFITNLIKSGVNINFVKELAGHSEISTTMGYIHIKTDDLREAVNKISII